MKEEILRYIVLGISILALPCVLFVVLQLFPLDSYTIAGTAVMLPSYIFLIMARVQLGTSFAVSPQAKELVTRGLYSKIRHPVYVLCTTVSPRCGHRIQESLMVGSLDYLADPSDGESQERRAGAGGEIRCGLCRIQEEYLVLN
jgi:protein-S-isoprenylcysteine O-methyltransferase Ste14